MSSQILKKNILYLCLQLRHISNRTCIAKIGREKYCRMYPTTVVNSDGSSFTIRYHEPRKIIHLPMDTSQLTPEELQKHLNRKKIHEKIVIEDTPDDDFDVNRYSHLWKTKPQNKK
ncbi:39S ribosomal protein L55, mitochondrial [Trichonephila clavata]|uniref:39S ribosomal protein L55, mitochondrial n=1 Tax=Trichonephila clavata TaxID=2740835 RepID=A0A8X6LLW2_TRICU|nr:39S ribosomal protein L55, mitochondrial [Trichonephila clavata]